MNQCVRTGAECEGERCVVMHDYDAGGENDAEDAESVDAADLAV